MRFTGASTALCRGLTVMAVLALLTLTGSSAPRVTAAAPSSPETRALWVLRTSLASPASIKTLIETARAHGFNTLLVQVRARGDAYFNDGLEPRPPELQRQPDAFDPLATVLSGAHAAGLRVHAWVNVNFVSSAVDLPAAHTHIVNRHPEWLMVPRELAADLARMDDHSAAYATRLAQWTRTQANVEGLYVSPIVPDAADHVVAVVRDLVARYPVDGVHLDYARYPNDRFDYSRTALREFRASVRPRLTGAERRTLDAREGKDRFVYTDMFPDGWKAFRIARMTALVARLRATITSTRATAMITVATAPDLQEARDHRLQDWGAWLKSGLVDAVCPMAYTVEPARFAEQIAAARQVAGHRPIWAGIGAYRLSPAQTIENIATARRLGAAGVILFSYDSLIDPRQASPDYIGVVGRSVFARPAAVTSGAP